MLVYGGTIIVLGTAYGRGARTGATLALPFAHVWVLDGAKLHTALAHVAATAQASDSREWVKVAGQWFSDLALAVPPQGRT